jgi:hypothetical protein
VARGQIGANHFDVTERLAKVDSETNPLHSFNSWRELSYRPLLILLGVAIFIRIALMLAYFPAVMQMFDSPRYARVNSWPLFADFWMPAGYPMLLRMLQAISNQLWVTIAIQHLMGLTLGPLLFLAMRHLGAARWAACIPAAVPLVCGDYLYLEHVIMADFLLLLLATAGITAVIRGLVPTLHLGWLALGSAFLAAAAVTRSVGIILVPVLLLCSVVWLRHSLTRVCAAALGIILPAALAFGLYCGARVWTHGQYLGLTDMRGWNLYARVAPFADCRKFVPTEETAILCEERAPSQRPGPFGYVWDLTSTPRRMFPLGPQSSKKMEAFAWRAICHQPSDYLKAVLVDLAKYLDLPLESNRPYSGQSRKYFSFGWRDQSVEKLVVNAMSKQYRGTNVRFYGRQQLAFYQNVFRVNGIMIGLFLILTVVGMFQARGSIGLGIWLFGLSACGLYLVPVLTLSYTYRYGIPAETFLAVSGVLGAVSVWPRLTMDKEGAAKGQPEARQVPK